PMSLHKYLFANSNPVMYSDPSGHDATLVDAMVSCGILGMLCSATIFWIDYAVHPDKNPNDFDYIIALAGGFVSGFIAGFLALVFEGAAFVLSWKALILMGYVLLFGGIGWLAKSLGKVMNSDESPAFLRPIGLVLETIGDGLMGPLYDLLSFDSDIIAFVYDLMNSLLGE
ncbi:MAG: hypothetical protein Q4C15_11765, partial [Eubacteriales bacterium]|nr:hypothetical protein [Eubacteriales bacterium]